MSPSSERVAWLCCFLLSLVFALWFFIVVEWEKWRDEPLQTTMETLSYPVQVEIRTGVIFKTYICLIPSRHY